MDMPIIMIIIGLAAIAGAAMLAIRYRQEKARQEQLQVTAREHGFSFSPEVNSALQKSLGGFHLFSQGRSRKAYNVLRGGIDDVGVTIFDYRYTTSSGKHQHTTHQTVLLFESQQLDLPFFTLRREHVFHKLAKSFGHQDIDFDDHPAFSASYLLQGPDEARIREIFSDQALAYLTRHDDLCIEGQGQWLIIYRAGRRVGPEGIQNMLQQGLDALDLFMDRQGILGLAYLSGIEVQTASQT